MSGSGGWTLAIDYGTTHTCAAVALGDEPPKVLQIEGERRLPSLVVLDDEGRLRTGNVARNLLARDPQRGERTPKRHLGYLDLLPLGPEGVPVVDAVAAVLKRVVDEGRYQQDGSDPERVILTHPVRWEEGRQQQLREAATRAGISNVVLAPEPVAAALHYAERHVTGAYVAIYDLGGGTYDTAVLRVQEEDGGFEIAGMPGGDPDIGGERFDDALFALVGERIADLDAELWERLANLEDVSTIREFLDLRTAVREAKEVLSYDTSAEVHVRALDRSVRVTRAEFEELIGSAVAETLEELDQTVTSAGVKGTSLAAIYLTGDSTRIPSIAAAIHRRFAPLNPTTWDDPKAVVALGATRSAPIPAPGPSGGPGARLNRLVADTGALCSDSGLDGAADRLRDERDLAAHPESTVVVVGETKRGKSSLINALVGCRGLVPVDADVATAVYLEIVYANAPEARVFTEDAPAGVDIDLSEVAAYGSVAGNPDNERAVTSVKVGVDSPLLARGLSLIDTPGVGGLEAGHRQITLATLSLADALLLVVDATAPLSKAELTFLVEATERLDTVLVAVTKIDVHAGWEKILQEDQALVARHAPRYRDAPFLAVSSVLKTEADGLRAEGLRAEGDQELAKELFDQSGYRYLEEKLLTNVIGRAETLRQANLCRTAISALERVCAAEELLVRSAQGDRDLEAELLSQQAKWSSIREAGATWRRSLEEEFRRLELRLNSGIDGGVAQAQRRAESVVSEGGTEALPEAARQLGDGVQGCWLDASRLLREGCETVVRRLCESLAAEGLDLAVETIPLPERRPQVELVGQEIVGGLHRPTEGVEESESKPLPMWRRVMRWGAVGFTALGVASGAGIPVLLVAPGAIDMLHERFVKSPQKVTARTMDGALRFVNESAQQASEAMRVKLKGQLDDARDLIDKGMEQRIVERAEELESALAGHRRRAAASEDQRRSERTESERRLERGRQLLDVAVTIRDELVATG